MRHIGSWSVVVCSGLDYTMQKLNEYYEYNGYCVYIIISLNVFNGRINVVKLRQPKKLILEQMFDLPHISLWRQRHANNPSIPFSYARIQNSALS